MGRGPFETYISSILSIVFKRHDTSILIFSTLCALKMRKIDVKLKLRILIRFSSGETNCILSNVNFENYSSCANSNALSSSSKKWRFATHWKICRSKFKRCFYSEKGEKLFFNVPVCQKSILILFSSETFGKRINNTCL